MRRLKLIGSAVVVSGVALLVAFSQGAMQAGRKAAAADAAAAAPARNEPARNEEARATLERVFGGALVSQYSGAATGDFNGDGSPDLAVAATASAWGVKALGDVLADWIVLDLDAPRLHPRPPVRVAPGDALIAIIHGHGPAGWRNPEARQAYVLKRAPAGLEVRPAGKAEVIAGARNGRRGVVRWTGARYLWREDE